MKIAVFEVEAWEREALKSLAQRHEVTFVPEPLTEANVLSFQQSEALSAFIYSKLRAPVLRRLPALRVIATRSTGVDHIDLDYCRAQGVAACNVPSYGERTVAEHVFALLLAISHRLIDAADRTRRGDFSLKGLQGFDLAGKTLGVIGTGAIGRAVIDIAKGFQMQVVAHDHAPDAALAARQGFRYLAMDEVLAVADVISLHVPGGAATQNMLSEREFTRMKRGMVLINTARGSVVDVQALLQALASGQVAAAGLDVLPEEPAVREEAELLRTLRMHADNLETLLADHVLLRHRHVIVTPHNAFNTREAVGRILKVTLENLEHFAAGSQQNLV
ncbi:MAG: hydroxyacid dehydrogenase [Alphaproteobacteria bacterium]|nr:hydroxyacid dehydrogenase [Alphaproteobacteria bacterium]